MTDDPLAHLYAEGLETDSDEIFASAVETSLARLNAEVDPERAEEISEHDLAELALLVGARLDSGGSLPDEEAAELGLGEIVIVGPTPEELEGEARGGPAATTSREFVLNEVGRAVLKRLVDERFPGLRS